jgi:hypothetical protein
MNKINTLLIFFIFLVSCGTLKEAGKVLRNEKVKTTDEFLVKKRDPLVIPPDFKEIPEPRSMLEKEENEEEKIKKILKGPKTENTSNTKSSSVENSIINRIGK